MKLKNCTIFLFYVALMANHEFVSAQSSVSLQLYNAVVSIEETKEIQQPEYQYSLFKGFEKEEKLDRSAKIEIQKNGKNLEIKDNGEREFVWITLRVPPKTNLEVEIIRDGKILVKNISGDLDIQIFSGEIDLESIFGGISLVSTRDTKISLDQSNIETIRSPIFISTYSGKVESRFHPNSNFNLLLSTEMGEIKSNIEMLIEKDENSPFEVKSATGTDIQYPKFVEHSVNGGGVMISFRTILGDIFVIK